MRFYGYKKLDNKRMSDDIEKIYIEDITRIGCEGKRARPIAITRDGCVYYLAIQIEQYIAGLEKYEDGFCAIDRNCIANLKRVSYYDTERDRLAYEAPDKTLTFVVIAFKYIKKIKHILQKLNIRLK